MSPDLNKVHDTRNPELSHLAGVRDWIPEALDKQRYTLFIHACLNVALLFPFHPTGRNTHYSRTLAPSCFPLLYVQWQNTDPLTDIELFLTVSSGNLNFSVRHSWDLTLFFSDLFFHTKDTPSIGKKRIACFSQVRTRTASLLVPPIKKKKKTFLSFLTVQLKYLPLQQTLPVIWPSTVLYGVREHTQCLTTQELSALFSLGFLDST